MRTVLYNILLVTALTLLAPYYFVKIAVTGKYRRSIGPKLGLGPAYDVPEKGTPRIWIHAVSVGEVTAAVPIVTALRRLMPDAVIVLSTSTETGQALARQIAGDADLIFYYPLDLPWVVNHVIERIRPDIFAAVETELWPNFLTACRYRGTTCLLVNGRISSRSFRRYRLTRFFWRPLLRSLDAIGAISVHDADRLIAIGADDASITVVGNAKYDGFAARTSPALRRSIAARLDITGGVHVLVAASTHEGEEEIVLSVYERLRAVHKDMILILVPRHVERADSVASLAEGRGFDDLIRLTDIDAGRKRRDERIILIDTIGELFKVYGLATVVFCGGSLVPRGGQNILEPAAWGAVICYGPSMDDFRDESRLLESVGAAVKVSGEEDLYRTVIWFLENDDERVARGLRGREVIMNNNGSSAVYAGMIQSAVERSHGMRGKHT